MCKNLNMRWHSNPSQHIGLDLHGLILLGDIDTYLGSIIRCISKLESSYITYKILIP